MMSLLLVAVCTASAADSKPLTESKQKISYALGLNMGSNLRRLGVSTNEIDFELLLRGLQDAQSGGATALAETEIVPLLQGFQRDSLKRLAEVNKQTGAEFLAANKSKDGVKIHPVALPDGKTAELQYKALAEGSGEPPTTNDTVSVNYKGTLIDGTEFDSSYKRGQPASFGVNRVIRGWTEGLRLMKPGAKYQFFIPAELAYGEQGAPGGRIPPNSTLIFDVELLSVKPTAMPPAPATAVTSDIIKVPSKEDLEKGAKIEVLKPEDVEKLKQQEQEKAKAAGAKKD